MNRYCAYVAALLLTGCARTSLPDWSGIWIAEGNESGISGFTGGDGLPSTDGFRLLGLDAPWKENYRQTLESITNGANAGKAVGWGFPMMMSGPAPLQFLITPRETLILNMYREVRHVYTDGRSHPSEKDRWATTWGDSIGRWEGDTLIIDTIDVRPPREYILMAPNLSARARYTERIRLVRPGRIESEVIIEDPDTLTALWRTKVVYLRAEGIDRLVHEDFENDRDVLDGEVFTIGPPQEAY